MAEVRLVELGQRHAVIAFLSFDAVDQQLFAPGLHAVTSALQAFGTPITAVPTTVPTAVPSVRRVIGGASASAAAQNNTALMIFDAAIIFSFS